MEFATINAVWIFFFFFKKRGLEKNPKSQKNPPNNPKLQKERGSSSRSGEGIFLEVRSAKSLEELRHSPVRAVPPGGSGGLGLAAADGPSCQAPLGGQAGPVRAEPPPEPSGCGAPAPRSGAAGACGPRRGRAGAADGPCRGPAALPGMGRPLPGTGPGVVPAAPPGAPRGSRRSRARYEPRGPCQAKGSGAARDRAASGSRLCFRAFQDSVTMNECFASFYKEAAAYFIFFRLLYASPVQPFLINKAQ